MKKVVIHRSRKGKPLRILFISAIVFVGILSLWKAFFQQEEPEIMKQSMTVNHEIGETESIIERNKNNVIGVHYPVLKEKVINRKIKQVIDHTIAQFKKDCAKGDSGQFSELYIDYETFSLNPQLASIHLRIEKNSSYSAHPEILSKNYTFERKTGKRLSLKDLFTSRYLSRLTDKVEQQLSQKNAYRQYKKPSRKKLSELLTEDYQNFLLTSKGLVICFDPYAVMPGACGAPRITVPYNWMKGLFRENIQVKYQPEKAPVKHPEQPAPRKWDKQKPMIALTFDDGPDPKNTREILKTLSANGGAATFFMLGSRVSDYPQAAQAVIAQGSEIGNHSWSHRMLTSIDEKTFKHQVDDTQKIIYHYTGVYPRLIRPPYGAVNNAVKKKINMPMILWNVDTEDWKNRNAEKITQWALSHAQDGSIILMHDIHDTTAAAVPAIIQGLKAKGFQLVTVSELYQYKGKSLENGKVYTDCSNQP